MRKLLLIIMIAALGTVALSAQDDAPSLTRVCLVLNIGQVDDGTFNQDAFEGLQAIIEDYALLPEETTILTSETPADHAPNIQQCVDENYGVVVTIGFQLAELTLAAAEANPNTYFIGVDHFVADGPPNYVGIQFRDDEAGFLVGVMAGLMTETDVVAGVYGPPIPPILRFRSGFEQGVAYAGELSAGDVVVLGTHLDNFDSMTDGAAAIDTLFYAGADVIFGAGGLTGSGAILEAATRGLYVIGVDQDEYFTTFDGGTVDGADQIITSALKRVNVGVYDMVSTLLEENFENFPGGGNYVLSVANGGISFANTHDAPVPDDVIEQVIRVEEQLASGNLTTGVDPVTGELIDEG